MYDPMDPPVEGIPADPLPEDLPEGESGEVEDEGGVLQLEDFENFEAVYYQEPTSPEFERGLADANAGRIKPGVLRSDEANNDE